MVRVRANHFLFGMVQRAENLRSWARLGTAYIEHLPSFRAGDRFATRTHHCYPGGINENSPAFQLKRRAIFTSPFGTIGLRAGCPKGRPQLQLEDSRSEN